MSNITLTRGDSRTLSITVLDSDGSAADLTGASIWWTAKRDINDADADAIISKTVGSGITVTNAAGGLATVTIAPDDWTDAEDSDKHYVWDLQVKSDTGTVTTVASGRIIITPDVTRAS